MQSEARAIAREAVVMAVQEFFHRLGLFVDEPEEMREYRRDFAFVRSQHRTAEAIALHARRIAVGSLVTASIYVLGRGFMLAIGRGGQ